MPINLLLERRELTRAEAMTLLRNARPPRLRTIREFAEQEIVLPDGPHKGRRFRSDRQPAARLWLDAIDSGKWRRHALTGCTQSGKSLCGLCIPAMYHLFETRETVIFGVPMDDMTNDKWMQDLLPAIEASRYRELIPTKGAGSRGGRVSGAVRFRHGVTLRFLTGGGSDKSVAGYTSRVLVVTETDGMDQQRSNSREADRITQMEARTDAYGAMARIYLECTTSVKQGRIWREYTGGTRSRVAQRCPHCGEYVTLGRDNLTGWEDAQTVMEAMRGASWVCPACGVLWSDQDRARAAAESVLLHGEQEMGEDGPTGDVPDTDTLGFRWSAPDNLFWTAGDVARREWNARRAPDEDIAERELCQFVWALPAPEGVSDITELSQVGITSRQHGNTRGHLHDDTERMTVGMDLGHHICHWTAYGWRPDDTPYIADYGIIEAPSRDLGVERGIMTALYEMESLCAAGWSLGARMVHPEWVWIDARHMGEVVYQFVRETQQTATQYMPSLGFGTSVYQGGGYIAPRARTRTIRYIGDGYHIEHRQADRCFVAHVSADYWKSQLHGRLQMPTTDPGALTLFRVERDAEHFAFAKHLLAESPTSEFVPGKGEVIKWQVKRPANHWLDSSYLGLVAGDYAASHAGAGREVTRDWFKRQRAKQ